MSRSRREFLHLSTAAASLSLTTRYAWGQSYPSRPVHINVGFAAGGPNDIIARLLGQWMADRLGQPFVVENRAGAGGNLATEAVVRAPPDGYQLLLAGTPNAINASLYQNLHFDFMRDIAPVAGVFRGGLLLVVHSSVPVRSFPEFIAYAKANPGKLAYGSGGSGGISHMTPELFKLKTGIDMVHVPYRGIAPALIDLLGGYIQVLFANPGQTIEFVKAEQLRALAISTATRSQAFPDIPAVAEFVEGFEVSSWFGFGAPRGTPVDVINELNSEINAGLDNPEIKARLADLDGVPLAGSPADFGRLIASETSKWAFVVQAAGLRSN
ncbi:Bug family tripartite tricarboxylate transporter substrate binding protein [Alsobacter sp. SYSU BS001988]